MTKNRIPLIILNYYFRFVYRSLIFVWALVTYIYNAVKHTGKMFGDAAGNPFILNVAWLVFAVDMLVRFFPARIESMGCRKQFAVCCRPVPAENGDAPEPELLSSRVVIKIAAMWLSFNAVFWILYITGVINEGILYLLALAFSVCDVICILFFCPFQTIWMKNRCCTSCRIYNWDYAMMFTPFVVLKGVYTWSLLGMSLVLLVRWELTVHFHPERFAVNTNQSLDCSCCEERLCRYKRQLVRFWEKEKKLLNLPGHHYSLKK